MSTIYVPTGTDRLYLQRWVDGKRLRVSTGLRDTERARKTIEKYDHMIGFLLENGRADVVEAIRLGTLTLADAYKEYRVGRWKKLPTAQHAVDLSKAWNAWAKSAKRPKDGKAISDPQRADLKRGLVALKVPKGASVGQLPLLLLALRERCGDDGHARTFNRVRTNCMAFARAHGGQRTNALWIDVAEVSPLDEGASRRAHAPQSPKDAAAIATRLGPGCGDDWWSLCLTGMRPSEFYPEHWTLVDGGLEVHGTKTGAATRIVPLLGQVMRPRRRFQQLSLRLRALGLGVTPYDARRSFAHWLEQAGIPDSQCDALMGHKPKGVRGLYREHDIRPHLPEIRKQLGAYMGEIGR